VLKNAKKRRKNGKNHTIFAVLAEKEGFEPVKSSKQHKNTT